MTIATTRRSRGRRARQATVARGTFASATVARATAATGDGHADRDDRDHGDREGDTKKKGGSQTSRVSGEVFATPSTRIVSFASSNDAAQAGRTVVSTDDGGH